MMKAIGGLFLLQMSIFANEGNCVDEYCFNGNKFVLTEREWKDFLPPERYKLLRQDGTEPRFENAYHDNKAEGIYVCGGCNLPLYRSEAKFDSLTGWPSFVEPICTANVYFIQDNRFYIMRMAVCCSRCDGHLGHVFNDGPPPKGLRYCMNSGALKFIPKK